MTEKYSFTKDVGFTKPTLTYIELYTKWYQDYVILSKSEVSHKFLDSSANIYPASE